MRVGDAIRVVRHLPQFRRRVTDLLGSLPVPEAGAPFSIYEPHPIRVLLIGSGHAIGYGVHNRSNALDGHLGRALHARSGRGVSVHNHARRGTRLATQISRAHAELGFGLPDLVVWCPSHLEMTERLLGQSWSRNLTALLAAADGAKVVVLELALPDGGDAVARSAARVITHINAGIRRAANEYPSVAVATPAAIPVGAGLPTINADGYRIVAERVADAAARLLDLHGATVTAPH